MTRKKRVQLTAGLFCMHGSLVLYQSDLTTAVGLFCTFMAAIITGFMIMFLCKFADGEKDD